MSSNRYVITHGPNVLLAEHDNVVWRTSPPIPTDWPIDPLREYPSSHEWELIASSDPRTDFERLYVPAHWMKDLGSSSYFYEPECEDRFSIEVLTIDDGRWVGRVDSDKTPATAMSTDSSRATVHDMRRVELSRNALGLGILAAPEGRWIIDASCVDRRLIVVMGDGELLYFAVDG
jgi:hypothetical protein